MHQVLDPFLDATDLFINVVFFLSNQDMRVTGKKKAGEKPVFDPMHKFPSGKLEFLVGGILSETRTVLSVQVR